MIIDMPSTTTSQVNAKLVHLREQGGVTTLGRVLTLDLKYGPNRERSIAGVRRVSKPGLRVYTLHEKRRSQAERYDGEKPLRRSLHAP